MKYKIGDTTLVGKIVSVEFCSVNLDSIDLVYQQQHVQKMYDKYFPKGRNRVSLYRYGIHNTKHNKVLFYSERQLEQEIR